VCSVPLVPLLLPPLLLLLLTLLTLLLLPPHCPGAPRGGQSLHEAAAVGQAAVQLRAQQQ
jgi:hypothetical protein